MRILITSALPYISGVKHLGNLVGSQLSADVYARFMRLRGHEVLCICATDEHGTPAELAAQEAGLDVAEFCREQHVVQAELSRRFRLDWDHFGRSSSKQNHELTQHFAQKLDEHGLIEERSMQQVYSIADQRFLPDRYIIGTCPHCGYDAARGDQCENCTRVLDPTDLVNPRSAISGSQDLEVRESRHLYLLQSKLVTPLRKWIDRQTSWPPLVTSIAKKWLDEGLQDRCITRDLYWGVPVNRPGFEGKVFYVWFDAPIAYIAATQEWAAVDPGNRDWKQWWYDVGDNVRYVQFMGKDNVPFHTIGFPATILGSQEPWKLVDTIKGFNWLNYYGGKFSTSQKRGVFMDQALEVLPSDYWRYSLLANSPEANDATFTWEIFQGTVNKDLADVFGNFANRTLRFCVSKWGNVVPPLERGLLSQIEADLRLAIEERLRALSSALEAIQLRKATSELRALWVLGNEYLQNTAPWARYKTSPAEAAVVINRAIQLVRLYALVARPFIPDTAEKVLRALGVEAATPWPESADEALAALPAGHAFEVPEVLFQKIEDAQVAAWKERFGGG